MREITFDLETTGLDPKQGHRVIEIGAVELIDRNITGKHFHCFVNPERDVPKAAEKVHGISTDFLLDKPLFKDVVKDFLDFIGNSKLVIHNAAFDMGFINFELKKCGRPPFFAERAIDTLLMARKRFPKGKASLDALCNKFNISLENREKHGALLDSELLAKVYIEMTGGFQKSFSVKKKEEKTENVIKFKKQNRQYRNFDISEQELQLHEEFLKKYILKS